MDAHALLSAQGWRGKGHSLHKTDDSIGLAKPLLLSRKDNTKGLGTKQHFTSDQWWMNAFDEQLKGLDTSKQGTVVQTVKTGKLNAIERGSLGKYALYTSFVQGGLLEGTLGKAERRDLSSGSSSEEDTKEPTPEVQKPAAAKETKEERRARREAKRKLKEELAQQKAARREKKAKSTKTEPTDDTDDEKRRRRARKNEKRKRREQEHANNDE